LEHGVDELRIQYEKERELAKERMQYEEKERQRESMNCRWRGLKRKHVELR